MNFVFFVGLTLLSLICTSHSRRSCVHRSYGDSATVCVCNVTYCDDLSPIRKSDRGIITLYESSIGGDRLKETVFKFGTNHVTNTTKSQTVSIDRNKKYQKIIGFGGAFTDAAGINIASLPKQMQTNILEDYFSESGAEYSVGRIPIGGSDFSTYPYSYCDVPNDDDLTNFNLTEDDLLHKIPYLKLAQKISPHKVKYFGSSWSPPAWMKTTQSFHKGGVLIGEPGGKYYQIWANYFVKFLDAYKSNGVTLWGLTVENEPDNGFKHLGKENRFNDLGFTPETQRDFVKLNLGPTLERAGYGSENLSLIIFDGEKRADVEKWSRVILDDKEAERYVSGIAFHWYENKPENIEILDKTHDLYPNKYFISSEACTDEKRGMLGSWSAFEKYAYDIITDLNHWTSSWVDWNMALDVNGGPNWADNNPENMLLSPILVNKSANEYYKEPIFYSMAHFSKFLIPDSQRIELNVKSKLENFETTAFIRPDKSTVLIALNMNNESVELVVDDPIDGKFSKEVKPHSLQSYVWFQ